MEPIPIPQVTQYIWEGTTGVLCRCGGTIEWAEAGYVPGTRACRSCLVLFRVHGSESNRRLVPQAITDDGIDDAPEDASDDDLYRVPEDLYPGWHQPVSG